ncbi:tetratricopeptide repeat-containing glycosyltransferase family 2 protein [Paenibacillus mendelii]|uniref:Glycosyltransferase n=1 Tax=Paenibacillus mendelii TaxID=206163 RepID=A0ABV6J3F6_9BACL|nr:TPR domain-containing glycosyltransferase [Paenibacillus mendelii]MCQ6563568.1 glycosyltransferase [Paenibacillus mendelii]
MLLSLCMIVKNEQDVLARCLDSVKAIVDEIIIIDTGSTDHTKEIAYTYTEHVYDYVWTNDFAAARNEGIRRATSRWILVMDADEYFPPVEAERLRAFLENEAPRKDTVFAISVVNFVGASQEQSTLTTGEIPRLFPNYYNIYYTRPIHEQLHAIDGTNLMFRLAPSSLFHTGYLQETIEAKDKLNRNANIFTELKKKTGFSAYDYYTIGNENGVKGDTANAIYYYERSLKKAASQKSVAWYPRCVVSLLQCYFKQNRLHDAWTLIETNLVNWSQYPEYHCMKGLIYFHLGFFEQAKVSYLDAFQSAEKLAETTHVFWLDSANYASSIPLRLLADIADLEFDTEKSIYYLTKLLMQNPYDYRAISQLIDYSSITQSPDAIVPLLNNIYEQHNRKHEIFMLKVSLSVGSEELAVHYYEQLKDVTVDLEIQDRLGFALITHNQVMFEEQLLTMEEDWVPSEESLIYLAIGALVWKADYCDRLKVPKEHELHKTYEAYRKFVGGEAPEKTGAIYPLLTRCYLYKFYEMYDQLVNTYSDGELINSLANFFYSKKQYEVALNYYSILLRSEELNAMSCENLAIYHLNHQYIDDGLDFLEMTIAKRPAQMHLYVLYLQHCPRGEKKRKFLKDFTFKFPQYRKIPALAQLVSQSEKS